MLNAENKVANSFLAVGLMSGTSVDGLDLALCRFEKVTRPGNERIKSEPADNPGSSEQGSSRWNFEILGTKTLPWSGTEWPRRFTEAESCSGQELMELHRDFGRFTGEAVNNFLAENVTGTETGTGTGTEARSGAGTPERPDLIASHGHTIFHQPGKGLTLQIGDGAEIAAVTGITTVSDFRRLDVSLGGQGAPLVPIGDELLFGSYDYCLNLGGFANISFRESRTRKAFDICPVNIVLNRLSQSAGHDFDRGGRIALSGKLIPGLLRQLESLEFYRETGPRSLGREWVDDIFMPLVDGYDAPPEDKLRTACEHIALRIASAIVNGKAKPAPGITESPEDPGPDRFAQRSSVSRHISSTSGDTPGSSPSSSAGPSILATGGGAKNSFLMNLIAEKVSPAMVVIPGEQLIDFKEAVVFAFLGVLRLRNEVNCLASVTGSRRDNSGGIIHLA